MADPVQILTSQFVDLGISAIDAMNKVSGISTPATIIQRPTYGAHFIAPNHIFGGTTAVVVSKAKSYYGYNYKTVFQIWKENKEF